ncbi:hypothetical protein BLNAU_12573 [Blattamonas nauphoetae]|uniref:Uncharacterized protein n=1 Tax=Blattamonas nauphoetae TaxID=2049346 RepID=A0ABQ9XPD7_9EUKA|nr:hypothetical protein BLNAU_12573 [Blattamonas nauphoetae]
MEQESSMRDRNAGSERGWLSPLLELLVLVVHFRWNVPPSGRNCSHKKLICGGFDCVTKAWTFLIPGNNHPTELLASDSVFACVSRHDCLWRPDIRAGKEQAVGLLLLPTFLPVLCPSHLGPSTADPKVSSIDLGTPIVRFMFLGGIASDHSFVSIISAMEEIAESKTNLLTTVYDAVLQPIKQRLTIFEVNGKVTSF